MKRKEVTRRLIAHGDLDGIISAGLMISQFGRNGLNRTALTFTQPFLISEEIGILEDLYVLDIAVNNRDPEMTYKFIERFGHHLRLWVDHHKGWSEVLSKLSVDNRGKFLVVEDAESTAQIIDAESVRRLPEDLVRTLVSDANAADTRRGTLSHIGRLIEEATKADITDDTIRRSAVRWIVNGCKKDGDYKILQERQKKYEEIQRTTEKLVEQYEIRNGVAVVDVRDAVDYDRTQLLVRGERMAPTRTAVLLGKNPQGEEMITIATMSDRNLVELFRLPSGSPSRVTLLVTEGWTVEKVLRVLA